MSLRLLAVVVLLGMVPIEFAAAGETQIVFEERGLEKLGIRPARGRTRNLTFDHTARRDVSGTPDLMAVETITVVGGIIFVERARPAQPEFACPDLSIDPDEQSGRRLSANFAGERVAGTLYDWELEPLVGFVRSGSDALFTYMGVHGEYHKSFAGNLAGFNLFLLDTFRSVRGPEQAHRVVSTPVPGYTVGAETDRVDKEATRRLKRWMRRNHLMFTDLDVDFVFRPESGELVVDGDPYWISVDSEGRGPGRVTGRFDDRAATLAANPVVFGSGFRLAKYAAVFRYLKAECPERWRALRQSVAKQKRALDLYTIPLRQMPYAVR
ncbi:MAG: hypothetical protein OXH09_15270 [Gammaproteobacteria bacterium]|nr:hypothetical protein [Gammaproteobacteria bacterium]